MSQRFSVSLPHSSVDTAHFLLSAFRSITNNFSRHTCIFFTCHPACRLGDAALSLWMYYCLGNRPGTIICATANSADVWKNCRLPRSYLSVRISVLLTEGGRVLEVPPDRVVFSWHWSASCPFLWLISLHFHPFLRFPITAQSQRFCINWKRSNWCTLDSVSISWVAHLISAGYVCGLLNNLNKKIK